MTVPEAIMLVLAVFAVTFALAEWLANGDRPTVEKADGSERGER